MMYPTDQLSLRQIAEFRRLGLIELGGHKKNKIYGKLDCRGARRWIAKGYYLKQRIFFQDEAEAISLGYRPCAQCMSVKYKSWKKG